MREIKLHMQVLQRRGFSGERHTRSVAISRRGVIIMWGSLQESRATTQVMLGVSLRARWDATLVIIIRKTSMAAKSSGKRGSVTHKNEIVWPNLFKIINRRMDTLGY